jgi:hypothetical protein
MATIERTGEWAFTNGPTLGSASVPDLGPCVGMRSVARPTRIANARLDRPRSDKVNRIRSVRFHPAAGITAETNQGALFGIGRLARPPRPDLRVKGVARTSDRNEFGASIGRRHRLARMQPGGRL